MIHPTMQRIFDATGENSTTEIAKKIQTNPQNVQNWVKRGISKGGAMSVSQAYGLDINWVLTGQGEMSLPPVETSNAQLSNKTFAVWSDGDEPPDGMIPISYLNTVVASMGHGYINDEPNDGLKLWFRQETIASCNVNPEFAKAITVRGESMLPELTEGQVIAIDTSAKRIFDGEIYAFRVGDELKIKYLFKHGDGFKAVSRNDDKLRFPDEYYTTQDIEANNIEIIGQFWWKSETRRVRR